jgi:hypothetical protein
MIYHSDNANQTTGGKRCPGCLWFVSWKREKIGRNVYMCAYWHDYLKNPNGVCDFYKSRKEIEEERKPPKPEA